MRSPSKFILLMICLATTVSSCKKKATVINKTPISPISPVGSLTPDQLKQLIYRLDSSFVWQGTDSYIPCPLCPGITDTLNATSRLQVISDSSVFVSFVSETFTLVRAEPDTLVFSHYSGIYDCGASDVTVIDYLYFFPNINSIDIYTNNGDPCGPGDHNIYWHTP